MVHLDLITLTLEILRAIYYRYIEHNQFIEPLRIWFMKNIGYNLFYTLIPNWFESVSTFLVKNTPSSFFYYIGTALEGWRQIANMRLVMGWFPSINPYLLPWAILTESVDFIIRPLCWRLPKMYYIDLSTWLLFYVLDLVIDIMQHLAKLSDSFHNT